ncbi:helicase SNF [Bacillus sp. MUM 116]|uniref:DEAD/DEAH box helicase n=1 Tax=Bacillus sp. MUM 116 TaxID=1678002 RepID=UPI0008F5DB2A|nr:DEAD/DEAH box helicase [Bacillus sp. MUM 116]OIK15712.1 helicase SNF [Bacillus sp. MUM 116]
MNVTLSQKMIKQLCGEHSYKKGEELSRRKKVVLSDYSPDQEIFHATVLGTSDFVVTVTNKQGQIESACTCPKLASYQKSCHHVAAVLVEILAKQAPKDFELTKGILGLFQERPIRPSTGEHHIEGRQLFAVEFFCKPIPIAKDEFKMGIAIRSDSQFLNLGDFLAKVERREAYQNYNPQFHYFQRETDKVLQELIRISDRVFYSDEFTYIDAYDWDRIFPLLLKAPTVKLEHKGKIFTHLQFSNGTIPLYFLFDSGPNEDFQLSIKGLEKITIIYDYVLLEGRFWKPAKEDLERLTELKKMLDATGTQQISIQEEQMELYLEQVIPGLKKVGHVRISEAVSKRLDQTSLKAKLYLDRIKNRLLAGLEFHYGNVVVNPLEERIPSLLGNGEQEEHILNIMEESGFTKTESGYFLQNEELEYHFLYHVVPNFKKLVQVYATTAVKARLFKENPQPHFRVDRRERTDWLSFRFELKGIPESEIRNLLTSLEEKRKYYRLRDGSFLSLESPEFIEMNRFLQGIGVKPKEIHTEFELPLTQGLAVIQSFENSVKIGSSLKQLLADLQNPAGIQFKIPAKLTGILRDYQKHGYQWLKTLAHYGLGGILADDMGLGKTLQSIAYIQSVLPEIHKTKQTVLIVSPSSLTYNWWNELKKFTPDIRAEIVDGSKAQRMNLLKNLDKVDVVITSYPLLMRDRISYEKITFHTLFLDEAQAFKNPVTLTAKAVKKLQAGHRFALTGTPIENSLDELWSIFHVVFPELFPNRKAFHDLRREEVAKRVRPFILRRVKEDVLGELPGKIESMHASDLLPDQKKLYAAYLAKLKHDTLKHLDKDTFQKNRIKILAGITRLRQLCCHPALFVDGYNGGSAKFEQLLKIIEECRSTGRRMLIFSQFTQMLAIIAKELTSKGVSYFYLDGSTPAAERVELCNRFNRGEKALFLISLKAGGTGLNLTGADTVILYDLWWNPAVEQQAADRAYRMGQKNTVQVIKLVAHGTIEEKMNELQEKKKHLIDDVIKTGEEKLSSLTEEDIREILMI